MRGLSFWKALTVVTILGLTLVVGTASASDTRHSATSGSLLIPTSSDLTAFPHLALEHDAFVELSSGYTPEDWSTGAPNSDGSARLVFHSGTSAWVVRLNDGAFGAGMMNYAWGGTAARPSLASQLVSLNMMSSQILDVDYARQRHDGAWSLGLSLARSKFPVNANVDYENTGFAFRGSWSSGPKHHFAAEVSVQNPKGQIEGIDVDEALVASTVFYRYDPDSDWMFHAGVNRYAAFQQVQYTLESVESFEIMASAGRNFRNDESGQVAGEVFIDYYNLLDGARKILTVPGVRIGIVQHLSNTFDLLAGATGVWTNTTVDGSISLVGEDTSIIEIPSEGSRFAYEYSLGVGAHLGKRVTIDAQVHPETIPTLVSLGNDQNVVAMASVVVIL